MKTGDKVKVNKDIPSINGMLREGTMVKIDYISNTPKHKFIEDGTIRVAEETGFTHEDTLQLTLSSVMGSGYKYEPIFVFKKES